jgi:hypothetical protein
MDDPRFYGLPDAWYPAYIVAVQWLSDALRPILIWWTEITM